MQRHRPLWLLLTVLLAITLASCTTAKPPEDTEEPLVRQRVEAPPTQVQPTPEEAEEIIADRAMATLEIIKNRDFAALAEVAHPSGVRFSPYGHVNTGEGGDLVFSPEQIAVFGTDETRYTWGSYDGTGFPIELTPREYFDEFVYTADFVNAETVSYNEIAHSGNTLENQFEVYPNAIIVEYHFSGFDPQYEGLDWQSLRLAFEEHQGTWYLVGVIHNQWTI